MRKRYGRDTERYGRDMEEIRKRYGSRHGRDTEQVWKRNGNDEEEICKKCGIDILGMM